MRRLAGAALLAVSAGACRTRAVGPPTLPGSYALVSVDGAPLPALFAASARDSVMLVSGSVTVRRTGEVRFLTVRRTVRVAPRRETLDTVHDGREIHGVAADGTIPLVTPCPRGAQCAPSAPHVARLSGDTLTVIIGYGAVGAPGATRTDRYVRRR